MGCWRERGSGWARTGPIERVGQTQNDPRRLKLARGRGQYMMTAWEMWVKSSQGHWWSWPCC